MDSKAKLQDTISFMILGTQKGGTTWLANSLRLHKDVFIPPDKELEFYSNRERFERGYDEYLTKFQGSENYAQVGEATPSYFQTVFTDQEKLAPKYMPCPAERIAADLPDIRLILTLRDPIERAISAFHHIRTRGLVPLNKTLTDVGYSFGIVTHGHYADHLNRWLELYPEERFCILIFEEEIRSDKVKHASINKVCRHLGIDEFPECDAIYERHNDSLPPSMAYFSRVPLVKKHWRLKQTALQVSRASPDWVQSAFDYKVTLSDRDFLRNELGRQIEELEKLLGRDLPWNR